MAIRDTVLSLDRTVHPHPRFGWLRIYAERDIRNWQFVLRIDFEDGCRSRVVELNEMVVNQVSSHNPVHDVLDLLLLHHQDSHQEVYEEW